MMFVLKSRYDALAARAEASATHGIEWHRRYVALLRDWNGLCDRVNAGYYGSSTPQFTDDELRRLLMLVHPDKHGGKQQAVDMTAKINQLRGK